MRSVDGRVICVVATRVQGPSANDPLTVALYNLKSSNKGKRDNALRDLRKIAPNERRPEVLKALEVSLNDPDMFARAEAVETYGAWATKENVPTLLAVLKDKEMFVRPKAIEALTRLKDERAIEPFAERLQDPAERGSAAKALKSFGPAAEKAVLARLDHPDIWTRIEACHILREIGTQQSIAPMQRLANDKDAFVKVAANDTLKVLQSKK